jgi:hypothetical protein
MARARNIKPAFFTNEELVELPFSTRLLFIGLWTIADRAGRLEDRPKRIKIELFPCDDINVDEALNDLMARGFVIRYTAAGQRYIQIVNFERHQNPHRDERQSSIPPPDEHSANTVQAPYEHGANTVQATLNEESLLLIPDSLNEESLSSALPREKKRATAFPEQFEPPYEWAADELGMTAAVVDRHVRCMRDWALSKGESRKDWQAFARNWLRKAKDEPQARGSPNGNGDSALAYFRSESEKRVST